MSPVRRLATAAVAVTYLQLIFGGIVRITGSGMGCGDHWPKCNGSWIPPFDNPLVMVEWTHRLLALLVVLTLGASAWFARSEARTGGEREKRVARSAITGFALVIAVALLGMVTVKLGNTALATVAHWTLAMTLLGVLVAAAVRAGALGGEAAVHEGGTARSARSSGAGAALAFVVVVFGALVAKTAGSYVFAHAALAIVLALHVLAINIAVRRRDGESETVKRALAIAAAATIAQVLIGINMYLLQLPPVMRVAHEATGVAVWLTMFAAAYLARKASSGRPA
jgi:cytochrome c oxidase assembly protein subunit 15